MPRRRRMRGTAAVEFAVLAPILCTLALGTYDLGLGVANSTLVAGEVRAGIRGVEKSLANDPGTVIRSEDGTGNNTGSIWGRTAHTYLGDCDPTQPTHTCGDPGGCVNASSFWTTPAAAGLPNPSACFSIGACTLNTAATPATCPLPAPGSWGTRPAANGPATSVIVIRIVLKFTPVTPFIQRFFPNGHIDIQRDGYAMPEY